MNTSSLPPSVRQLISRMRTQSSLLHSHENHDLKSLATRVMLSKGEVLDQIADGKLLALSGPINGKYLFSASALDTMRNSVVSFIAREIVTQLSARGADEQTMTMACQRAFTRQHDLSRQEQVIEFDQGNGSGFVNGVGTGVGIGAAGLAGYAGYRYLKNRKRNPDGSYQLPGPGGSGPDGMDDAIDVTPKPKAPSGGGVVDAMNPRLPGPPGASRPALTNGSPLPNAADDALGSAVKRGRQAIAKRGSAIWRALKSVPLE